MTITDLYAILPLVILAGWGTLLIAVDLFIPLHRKDIIVLLASLGLLTSLGFTISQIGKQISAFNGMVIIDGFATFLMVIFLASGLFSIALSFDYLKRMGLARSEYYILLLLSITGMLLMAIAADLIVVFLALELLSIPLYVMAGFARPRLDSEEAALKYFLLGAFSGGFVVYGIALVFGATGTTSISGILSAINLGTINSVLFTVGAALILIGLGFKVAAVPFHMWTPDVYQGSPTAVTAFMSVGAKAGGFAALLRVFFVAFPDISQDLTPIFWVIAVLTMILGNVVAIAQNNIKRMLAYSSIAHAGYILMGLVTMGQTQASKEAIAGALFYLFAYMLTSFGSWAIVITLETSENKGLNLKDYAGLGKKYPALAAAMAVFMLSFIGVPPTLGFVGKFYIFRAVIQGNFIGLAIIGVFTSLISAFFYLRIVVLMYMQDGNPEIKPNIWLKLTVGLTAIATVLLSIFSTPIFQWASQSLLAGL